MHPDAMPTVARGHNSLRGFSFKPMSKIFKEIIEIAADIRPPALVITLGEFFAVKAGAVSFVALDQLKGL